MAKFDSTYNTKNVKGKSMMVEKACLLPLGYLEKIIKLWIYGSPPLVSSFFEKK
jgi:hypothetical protein